MKVGDLIRVKNEINVCGEIIKPGYVTRAVYVSSGTVQPAISAVRNQSIRGGLAYCDDRFEPLANVKDNWTDRIKKGDKLLALVDSPLGDGTVKAGHVVVVGVVLNGQAIEEKHSYAWPIGSIREWFVPLDDWRHPTVEEIKIGDKLEVADDQYHGNTKPGAIVEFVRIVESAPQRAWKIKESGRGREIQIETIAPKGNRVAGRWAFRFKPVGQKSPEPLQKPKTLQGLIQGRFVEALK